MGSISDPVYVAIKQCAALRETVFLKQSAVVAHTPHLSQLYSPRGHLMSRNVARVGFRRLLQHRDEIDRFEAFLRGVLDR